MRRKKNENQRGPFAHWQRISSRARGELLLTGILAPVALLLWGCSGASGQHTQTPPPQAHSVALTWDASTSTDVGYNVYRSTVSGTGYTKLNSSLVSGLAYTDSSVQNGTTYFYVTTAVDASRNESVYSNEVSAAIP